MYDLVFKQGNIFFNGNFVLADLAINGEKIAAIGENLIGKTEISAQNKWVLPGAIDVHTHFSLPFAGRVSADDFYTGSVAGAAGGVTTFIDFTAQNEGEGVLDSLKRRKAEAKNKAAIDYSFHACISNYNDAVIKQLPKLASEGVTSLKIFTAYRHMMQTDDKLAEIMEKCKELNILVTVHAENGALIEALTEKALKQNNFGIEALSVTRPTFSEVEAIGRVADFARHTGCNAYIVHVSSGEGALRLAAERQAGAPINGETCPQYMYLDNSYFEKENGHYFACCPPIRPKNAQKHLYETLNNRGLAVVATDHCPFNKSDKDTWEENITKLPMGLPGIETLPMLVLNACRNNILSAEAAIKSITENPAKIFGLYPEKGCLQIGSNADIMLYDPDARQIIKQKNLHMNNDYSVYEGLKVKGKNLLTMLRGQIIYDAEHGFKGKAGQGRFIKRRATDGSFFGK